MDLSVDVKKWQDTLESKMRMTQRTPNNLNLSILLSIVLISSISLAYAVSDAETWKNKGVALEKAGKYAEAVKAYDQAIKLNPKYVEAWNNKGVSLFNLGKYEVSIRVYEQAIKLDPNDADVWYNKGIALEKLGKYEEANKCFIKSKELERIKK